MIPHASNDTMNWSQWGALATLGAIAAIYLPRHWGQAHGAIDVLTVVGLIVLWLRVRKHIRWA